MMKLQLITSLVGLLFAGSVFAQTATESNRSVATQYATAQSNSGLVPSVGVAFGHMDQSGKSDEDGDGVTAQVIGTYYFDQTNWLADAGLGIHKQYFTDLDAEPLVGILSVGGRYEFAGRWSIGPTADLLFGSNEGFGTGNQYLTMAGLTGFKEIVFENDQLVRLGIKYAGEIGTTDQTNNYVGIVAQWGLGSGHPVIRNATTAMNE